METASSAIDWPAALQKHRPWLAKVLRCRIGDRNEVDDLLQEIALAVFRQHAKSQESDAPSTVPTDPSKVAPWLYRLAVRQAVNFHRRAYRKCQVRVLPEVDSACRNSEPLDWMLAQEQRQHLDSAIKNLKPQHREILVLKYTENWSYRQLSEHLGIPVRSVEYRLLQARKQLRANLVNGVTVNSNSTSV